MNTGAKTRGSGQYVTRFPKTGRERKIQKTGGDVNSPLQEAEIPWQARDEIADGAISHRVRGVGADHSDAMVEEGGVDCGDFDLGHVAGDAVGFADRAGGDCASLRGLGFGWRRGRLGVAA